MVLSTSAAVGIGRFSVSVNARIAYRRKPQLVDGANRTSIQIVFVSQTHSAIVNSKAVCKYPLYCRSAIKLLIIYDIVYLFKGPELDVQGRQQRLSRSG